MDLTLGDQDPFDVLVVLIGNDGRSDDGVLEIGQYDPAFHLAPLHTRLSGEVRESERYPRSRRAFNPEMRFRRRPGRPSARSRTASTSASVAGEPLWKIARSTNPPAVRRGN